MKRQVKSTFPGATWGTTKASGNLVNYLLYILLRKNAINNYEITAIKDPICLGEEYVVVSAYKQAWEG